MTVKELMTILEDMDPDANVYLGHQPSWPFEYSIAGVAIRETFEDEEDMGATVTDEPHEPTDVLIVEGRQLCYGNRAMWDAARRY